MMIAKQFPFLIPILYVIAWCISPPLSYGSIYRIIAVGSVIYLLFRNWTNINSDQQSRFVYTIFLIIYMILLGFVIEDKFVQRIHMYIFLLVGLSTEFWNNKLYPKNIYRIIIIFTFTLYIIWNICSINALFIDSHIMRALVRNSDESYIYSQNGVGGYGYLYSIVVSLPFGIAIFLNRLYDKTLRLVALIFSITSFYLIFLSGYFMAQILAILCIPLIFVSRSENTNIRIFLYCMFFGGMVIVFINLESIITFLINTTDSQDIRNKLTDSYMILANDGNIDDSEFDTRAHRYGKAIDAFISNPLVGCLSYKYVGNHSSFLDYFGQYGIIVGSLFIYLFFKPVTRYLNHNRFASVVILITLIISIFNILPLSCLVPLYILLPTIINYSNSLKNEK